MLVAGMHMMERPLYLPIPSLSTRNCGLLIGCDLTGKIAPLEIHRQIDQTDHHRNFNQWADDGGEGST